MSVVLQPFGLQPVYAPGEYANARRYDFGIASGYATSLLKYQPVALNASGQIVAATSGADFLGVFDGVFYTDTSGIPHENNQWIAGTTYQANTPMWVNIYDDPTQVYKIQCDGSLVQSMGGQLNFTAANIAAGSTIVGLSQATAQASSLTTSGQGQLSIRELDLTPGNAWGDAFTIVRVTNARSQFVANKLAV